MDETLEIEVKLPAGDDPEAMHRRLLQAGAQPQGVRAFEENRVYDFPDGRLRAARVMVRLRETGGRGLITIKTRVPDEGDYKVRRERETGVDDPAATAALFGVLGLEEIYRYQKYRRLYTSPGLHICLDETPLGNFVELEGDTGAIDAFAGRLGLERSAYIKESYRGLHLARMRDAGESAEPRVLIFEPGR